MANQEHLDILKQGVETWNQWREEHPEMHSDLRDAFLSGADLRNADLFDLNLRGANLSKANLRGANFIRATLRAIDLSRADLSRADLTEANLGGANLRDANLSGAILRWTDLTTADFSGADLSRTILHGADLIGTNLSGANLSQAEIGGTIFGNVDLRSVKGLERVKHIGSSIIGTDTLVRSQGDIPEAFLRGAGLPDSFIEYVRSLISHPIEYYPCFISYSSKDDAFARRLYNDLQSNNVRCWFAPEDMKIGDRIRPHIDESIRIFDKLLLVLSEHSIASTWVEFEVEAAMDKEQEGKPPVLFPVRLDNTVMESTTAWATHIKRTRHIGDFSHWKNHDDYEKAFNRLLRDLKAAPGRL